MIDEDALMIKLRIY